jgi:hypothetical protein
VQMAQECVSQSDAAVLQSCSPDLAPSDFHLSGPLKQHLGRRRFHCNAEVEMAVGEWLGMQQPDFYRDGIFKLVPRWDKCIGVLGH